MADGAIAVPPPPLDMSIGRIRSDKIENNDFFYEFNSKGDEILGKFRNFNFRDLIGDINRISHNSRSGVISLLKFSNSTDINEFICALKTTINDEADNSYYEFLVGLCLNKVKEYFPNFLFTFNYYQFNNDYTISKLKDGDKNIDILKEPGIIDQSFNYNEMEEIIMDEGVISSSCREITKSAILIEGLENSISFETFLNSPDFSFFELLNIYLQLYYTLNSLSNVFTHYDLHYGNVLLKKIPDNKYIDIRYTFPEGILAVRTKFIPVIIDYGRCFIDCSAFEKRYINSKNIIDKYCNTSCNNSPFPKPTCIITKPNSLIFVSRNERGEPDLRNGFTISELKNNSTDLRFVYDTFILINRKFNPLDPTTVRKFQIDLNNAFYFEEWMLHKYHVPERLGGSPDRKITDINGALQWFIWYYRSKGFEELARKLPDSKIWGMITIDYGKKWEFREF